MTYHGKTDRTRSAYERVLRDFETFLADERGVDTPGAAEHRDCMAWIHRLRGSVAESTVATYAAYLHRFYAYMVQVGTFESNPMTLVAEEMDERINTDPTRREITVPEMRQFLAGIDHPLDRALLVTMLKTGIRVGELCNLDLRDLSLPITRETLDIPIRPQLDGRGDALFVAADHAVGDVSEGERRTAANKRKRATVIPVDEELRTALVRWLAIRPDPRSDADPLFLSTADNWGKRVTPHVVHHTVESHARERGWHRDGGGAEENVTPHYFRHFFTTHLRDRTGDRGIVKYLRGDVASDIIDTYTHDWGDRVRHTYEENIYRLT
ncbi:tyrosine-type recombinase/integrase [Haloplanus halobius]|uniref:tyrosine-type recombinase/integrase n=1 Tax=Haloplanus halobius TaxID=2934938 RepID=UPI00200EFD1E|nr:tyrosine-type recombinase/integrase [Haloplanus sp. XH21]